MNHPRETEHADASEHALESQAEAAFLEWWEETHDWDFLTNRFGTYEMHAHKCFIAGWKRAKE